MVPSSWMHVYESFDLAAVGMPKIFLEDYTWRIAKHSNRISPSIWFIYSLDWIALGECFGGSIEKVANNCQCIHRQMFSRAPPRTWAYRNASGWVTGQFWSGIVTLPGGLVSQAMPVAFNTFTLLIHNLSKGTAFFRLLGSLSALHKNH